jgi:hypothetical protein
MAFARMPSRACSRATARVSRLTAAFEAAYGGISNRCDGRDGGDHAGALGLHDRQHRFDRQETARDIRGKRAFPNRRSEIHRRCRLGDAHVVVEDIDAASRRAAVVNRLHDVLRFTMTTKATMALAELSEKGAEADLLREMIRHFAQRMMDMDVESRCAAAYGERSPERVNSRNGYRERQWDTRAGTIDLQIPKPRKGAISPVFWSAQRCRPNSASRKTQSNTEASARQKPIEPVIRGVSQSSKKPAMRALSGDSCRYNTGTCSPAENRGGCDFRSEANSCVRPAESTKRTRGYEAPVGSSTTSMTRPVVRCAERRKSRVDLYV